MKEEKIIDTNTDYGCIEFLLKEKMEEKGISIDQMSEMSCVKYDLVANYYYNRCNILDSKILAKFCFILDCSIKDIMRYDLRKKEK